MLSRMVKKLADHESKKARERQTQTFEDEKKKKAKEKEAKKRAAVKELIGSLMKKNEAFVETCVKPADFKQRLCGRRASDSLAEMSKAGVWSGMEGSRRVGSREHRPRYYRPIN